MLVPQKNKTINWQISQASILSRFLSGRKYFPTCLSLLTSFRRKKLIKEGKKSHLPFKFSHAQWFLEHWTLVSDVVSSLPRWSIAVPPVAKPVPCEGRVASLHDKRRCQSCNQNQQTKNKPRNVQLNLQQCGDAAEVIWHLCASFFPLSFIFPSLPSEAPVSAGSGFCGNYGESVFPSEKLSLWQPYIMYMA